jgi:hypothetical protein
VAIGGVRGRGFGIRREGGQRKNKASKAAKNSGYLVDNVGIF